MKLLRCPTARIWKVVFGGHGDTYSLSREVDSSVMERKFNFIVLNDSEGRLQQLNSGDVIYTENGLSDSYFREY